MILTKYQPGGKVTMEAKGYKGQECRQKTAPYLARSGGQVVSDEPTLEAQEEQVTTEAARQGC